MSLHNCTLSSTTISSRSLPLNGKLQAIKCTVKTKVLVTLTNKFINLEKYKRELVLTVLDCFTLTNSWDKFKYIIPFSVLKLSNLRICIWQFVSSLQPLYNFYIKIC